MLPNPPLKRNLKQFVCNKINNKHRIKLIILKTSIRSFTHQYFKATKIIIIIVLAHNLLVNLTNYPFFLFGLILESPLLGISVCYTFNIIFEGKEMNLNFVLYQLCFDLIYIHRRTFYVYINGKLGYQGQ